MLYPSWEVKWKKYSSFFPHWFVFSSPPHWYFGRVHVPEVTKCVLRSCGLIPDSATPLIAPVLCVGTSEFFLGATLQG